MTDEILLEAVHLTKIFGRGSRAVRAVDDVSFSVKRGEVFGLVGESGCGKTTAGRAIIGLGERTSGDILFAGKSLAPSLRRRTMEEKRKLQMIFQDPIASLDPRMTVRESIAEGLSIAGGKSRREMDEAVQEMLGRVGLLREHADRYPHEFSGGQRQRIGIARALILHPEFVIADEPVSALDVSVQAQVIRLLDDLRESLGLTLLFIAHDLSVVKYFSDRIGVMYRGRLVELADSDELFAHPAHPYTKSLLSAIPLPDPILAKSRRRVSYQPTEERLELREIAPGHFAAVADA